MGAIKKQGGFVAITSVLIVSALVLVLGISMFHNSLEDQTMSSAFDKGQEASLLADFCLRQAFQSLKQDINYAGDEDVEIGGMSCTINPIEDTGTSTKKISTYAAIGDQPNYKRQEQTVRYAIESRAEDWLCDDCNFEKVEVSGDSLRLSEDLGEGEETEGISRITALASDWEEAYYITGLETDGDDLILSESQAEGYRISDPLSLDQIKHAGSALIEWTETVPENTEIKVYTRITESPTELPGDWELATSSQPIPEIAYGSDLSGKWLWVKQELKTTGEDTPRLHTLTETIMQLEIVPVETEGYRVSPELDVSGTGTVKNSQIFWQADTRSDASLVIETRLYDSGDWTDWETAENKGVVPGLAEITDLTETLIQTRATFYGGPDHYPSLSNINIFIEVE